MASKPDVCAGAAMVRWHDGNLWRRIAEDNWQRFWWLRIDSRVGIQRMFLFSPGTGNGSGQPSNWRVVRQQTED